MRRNPDWGVTKAIFADVPHRKEVPWNESNLGERITVVVYRNEVVEPTLGLARRMASHWGIDVEFQVGQYDDSLAFPVSGEADAMAALVWPDWRRLGDSAVAQVESAIGEIRSRTSESIPICLITPFLNHDDERLGATVSGRDLDALAGRASVASNHQPMVVMRDTTLIEKFGTDLTPAASALIAREIGGIWLPTILRPEIKCVVVDLDNTLYDGVLGEDGVSALRIEERHRQLSDALRARKDEGVMLAIASKNDARDVVTLLGPSGDFPLGQDDFVVIEASWNSKTESLEKIASKLSISQESMLFIDDNPAELQLVEASGADVWSVRADDTPTAINVVRMGARFIGKSAVPSVVRENDIRANETRRNVSSTHLSYTDLHENLATRVAGRVVDASNVGRVAELARKTNQFNLALTRSSDAWLSEGIERGDLVGGIVNVCDRLADSGDVAAVVLDVSDARPTVIEFLISCRALGRGLETIFFAMGVKCAGVDAHEVDVEWVRGPRNEPSLTWLVANAPAPLVGNGGKVAVKVPFSVIKESELFQLVTNSKIGGR